jgi:hypothetical protein
MHSITIKAAGDACKGCKALGAVGTISRMRSVTNGGGVEM